MALTPKKIGALAATAAVIALAGLWIMRSPDTPQPAETVQIEAAPDVSSSVPLAPIPAPEPQTEEQIYASEPWYSVAPGDVFPEEIATFALANLKYRKAFLKHHAELLEASYWQQCQKSVARGKFANVYPYPNRLRFKNQKS